MKSYSRPLMYKLGNMEVLTPFRLTPISLLIVCNVLGVDQAQRHHLGIRQRLEDAKPPAIHLGATAGFGCRWLHDKKRGIHFMPTAVRQVAVRYEEDLLYCAREYLGSAMETQIAAGNWKEKQSPFLVWAGLVKGLFVNGVRDYKLLAAYGEWEIDWIIATSEDMEQMAWFVSMRVCAAYSDAKQVKEIADRMPEQSPTVE